MSQKRDFYEVLGVAREASGDEIKRAYRQAALKHHPDRNPGNAEAEIRFKEATEAYSVLSDATKRTQYDRFGHQGVQGGFDFEGAGVGDILSQFQEMFADFFGGFGGQQRRRSARGQDVRVHAKLTLTDVMLGGKHEVNIRGQAPCETCSGSGARPGTSPETCSACRGTGQVTAQRGFIMFSSTCARCRGSGRMIASPCETCSGRGSVERQRKVLVSFPAGIDTGHRLRVPGQGMPGPDGTPPGDLYVDVEVEAHERFERHGDDLAVRVDVSFSEVALGTKVEITLPDDAVVSAAIPGGTQPNAIVTVKGKGVPLLHDSGRGDLHVVVGVSVPTRLSKRAKKLLEELDAELRGEPRSASG